MDFIYLLLLVLGWLAVYGLVHACLTLQARSGHGRAPSPTTTATVPSPTGEPS